MPQDATPFGAPPLDALLDAQLVAVVRETSQVRAQAISEALLGAGIRALEITATTPGVFSIVEALGRTHSGGPVTLGVGTIRRVEEVAQAEAAGACFLVSPHTDPQLIEAARKAKLISIPGAFTPTEIMRARSLGADVVKIFPISTAGGARYLRLIAAPLGAVPLWVSGTVAIDEIEEYVEAGASLIGLTSALLADLPDKLEDAQTAAAGRARQALFALGRAKNGRPLIAVGKQSFKLSDLVALPSGDKGRLEDLIEGKRGQAVRLRPLLLAAGVGEKAMVEVRSSDGGFRRQVSAESLHRGGWLHYATDGLPLPRAQGGPLRLYVVGGDKQCDNVKGIAEIVVVE